MLEIHYSPNTSRLEETNRPGRRWLRWFLVTSFLLLAAGWWVVGYLNMPPPEFVAPTQVTIESGSGVRSIGTTLAVANVIRSPRWFSLQAALFYDPAAFQAGTYEFAEPQSIFAVIERLQRGEALPQDVSVTLVEGQTRAEYADTLAASLPNLDQSEFLSRTEEMEGYLFPDTYRFAPEATVPKVVTTLTTTFASRTEPLSAAIAAHSFTEDEVVNLASILEKEANSPESMRMVSGILQNRLEIGMALQADATVGYVLDKPLSDLVPSDLDLESPYNTYLHPGLPPTPISNPGLIALRAVLEPTPSSNLYYITGNDGNFYYAETYDEHQRNIARYLR